MTLGNDFKKPSPQKLAGAEVRLAPEREGGRRRVKEVSVRDCAEDPDSAGMQASPPHACNVSAHEKRASLPRDDVC